MTLVCLHLVPPKIWCHQILTLSSLLISILLQDVLLQCWSRQVVYIMIYYCCTCVSDITYRIITCLIYRQFSNPPPPIHLICSPVKYIGSLLMVILPHIVIKAAVNSRLGCNTPSWELPTLLRNEKSAAGLHQRDSNWWIGYKWCWLRYS